MTTIGENELTCAICGKTSKHRVLTSTSAFGSPDLDLRPPQLQRSTMHFWVQECPYCGYVADDLEECSYIDKGMTTLYDMHRFVRSAEYVSCAGEHSIDEPLAARFFKAHIIAERSGDHDSAMKYLIRAAWVYDDLGDTDNASYLRSLALKQADLILSDVPEEKDTLMLIREDLLRRSGRFGQLIEEYSCITFKDPMLDAINAFQIEKSKEGDTGCYTVRDAVPAEEEDDDGTDESDDSDVFDSDEDDYADLGEDLPEWLSMWIDALNSETAEFDHEYLQRLGISFERVEEETKFLGCLNEDLQVRTGEKVSENMPEELLEEFDSISDPYEAMIFLEEHCPDYISITMRCIWEISCELIRYIDRIPGADTAGKPPLMDEDISLLELDERIISRLRTMGVDTVGDIVMTDLSGVEGLSSDDTNRIAVSVMKMLMSERPDNDAV